MTGYAEYYQRAIEQQQNGIKLVLGPTGLGKSSRIPEVVKNNLTHKFIYLTRCASFPKQPTEQIAGKEPDLAD